MSLFMIIWKSLIRYPNNSLNNENFDKESLTKMLLG